MYNEGRKAFDCATAVEAKRVLQIAANGNVSHNSATATNAIVGVSEIPAAVGDHVGVILINVSGSVEIEASEAITVGADVYAAASGKVSVLPAGAGDYRRIGMALEASTADGDVIEILLDPSLTVTTLT